jgi:ArsR family transcriptional regulator, arsenate/arsenite/antimonite-responsive transcriptional repressor
MAVRYISSINEMKEMTQLMAALSDANRLRLVFALRNGELCVCQLIALLELAPSTVSKHLSILQTAGVVERSKKGRWVYYRLCPDPDFPIIGKRAPEKFQRLEKSEVVSADDRRLKDIVRQDPEALCRIILRKP